MSVADAFERSLRNASGLSAKDSALVAASRVLAKRIDLLADGGFIDANGKLDNVTVPTFLKYLQALGLTVDAVQKAPAKAKSGSQTDMLAEFRRDHRQTI
jgi:ribosomal protein S8